MVAYVDGDWLAWYGWPYGEAKVSDCDLVKACTDEEHRRSLEDWSSILPGRGDRRTTVCRAQLFELNQGYVGANI